MNVRTLHLWLEFGTDMYSSRPSIPVRCSSPCTCSTAIHEPPRVLPLSHDVSQRLTDSSINEDVIIRLKWGQTEYKGKLISVDSYMNIQLSETEEYIDRKPTGTLGQVLIRSEKCYAWRVIRLTPPQVQQRALDFRC
jgi:small nuclear ribonucleoprotein (snRNP)-like protein